MLGRRSDGGVHEALDVQPLIAAGFVFLDFSCLTGVLKAVCLSLPGTTYCT